MENFPRFVVIKPVIFKTYAGYETGTESGHVYCREKSVFNPLVKIEIEPAKNSRKYCHLRFCHSNRYWARSADDKWIVAVSKQPVEDTSKSSCTLFEPTIDDNVLHLTHVQSGRRVLTDSTSTRVYVYDDEGHQPSDRYAFTYADWDQFVKIPKRVAFRGDNGKILKGIWLEGYQYLQFSSTDGNDGHSAQEVSLHPDGHLRIKSEFYDKFWRRSPNWIWGDSTDDSGKDVDTLFWPVKVDSRTIALRNAGNNQFCKRLTIEGKTSCLNAAVSEISDEAKLVVEELVLERNIYNVRFRMEDARVFDEQPYLAGIGTAINESDTESSLTVKVAKEVTSSSSFTRSYSLMIGAKTTFQTGIPSIAEGKIDVSAEFTGSREWGSTTEEKKIAEASYTVNVPPKSVAKVNYVGTRGRCSVPFSYTQRDKRSGDGKYVTTHHTDGIFDGTDYYSFRFEQLKVEPL